MSLYETLKAAKLGAAPDVLTTLRAQIAPFAKGGSTPVEKELEDTPPLSFGANGEPLIAWTLSGNMAQTGTPLPAEPIYPSECGELVNTGEHSGEYMLPVQCGGVTTNVYLNEPIRKIGDNVDYKSNVAEYRAVKKLVLTGDENVTKISSTAPWRIPIDNLKIPESTAVLWACSHYQSVSNSASWSTYDYMISWSSMDNPDTALRIRDYDFSTGKTADDFKAFLAQQYANGTPVTIWYVLATPTTTTVEAPAIPTASGSNTLSVGTTVQPSRVYIKYKE